MKPHLKVTPNDLLLTLTGTIGGAFTAYITLKNTSSKPVCFVVRTTDQENCIVDPYSGLLRQGESQRITVMMPPFEKIPPAAKFMVRSCKTSSWFIPAGDIQDFESIFKNADPSKICCNFFMAAFIAIKKPSSETVEVIRLRQEMTEARRDLNEAHGEIGESRATHSNDVNNIHQELTEARQKIEENHWSHLKTVKEIHQEMTEARRELIEARREIEESRVAHSQARFQCEICLEEFTDVAGNRALKVLREFLTGLVKS
ncbi:hypothetical protein GCK72_011611 [Caenorhabditis remanei]|uniref:Major sperm protein n=1 Tax=Caenorhabditis remanei TaxID=31234 RepID=A0A6A5H896_CAERE|nr:hypothetical protein GCK72_011611 [Caenorhabditis remanei]KAF1763345.1 hypothetical protein GCK72_011611 [Caenorhabditis remanei]